MNEDEGALNIDLPPFDERAIRRAMRRAVVRTATTAVVGVLVVLMVVGIASTAWSARTRDRMGLIMGRAYQAANPGYLVSFYATHARLDFGTKLEGGAQALEPGGFSSSSTRVTVRQRFYGHVSDYTGLTMTRLDALFCCVERSDKERVPHLLEGLPASVAMSALVELKEPLDEETFTAFRHRNGICGRRGDFPLASNPVEAFKREAGEVRGCGNARVQEVPTAVLASMVLSPSHLARAAEGHPEDFDGAHRLTWPDYTLIEFRRWVAALRGSDEHNLRTLLLPGVSEIKRRAREGKIYGFIVTGLRPERLRQLLKAPEFGDITIADIAFAVD